jgi:hypothetical protein
MTQTDLVLRFHIWVGIATVVSVPAAGREWYKWVTEVLVGFGSKCLLVVTHSSGFGLLETICRMAQLEHCCHFTSSTLPFAFCVPLCVLHTVRTLSRTVFSTQSQPGACKSLLETGQNNGDLEHGQFNGWDELVGKCLALCSLKQFCFRLLLSKTTCQRLTKNKAWAAGNGISTPFHFSVIVIS